MTTHELRTADVIKQNQRCWIAQQGKAIAGFAVARTPKCTCILHSDDALTAVSNGELYATEAEAVAAAEQQKITYKIYVKTDWDCCNTPRSNWVNV